MSSRQMWAIGMSLALAACPTIVLLMIWWVGLTHEWNVLLVWNDYREAWVEGVVLHGIALLLLLMIWKVKKWQR